MNGLTIKQVKDNKSKLESDLCLAINQLVTDFERDNDVAVSDVSVNLWQEQRLGEHRPTYVLTGVDVTIDI